MKYLIASDLHGDLAGYQKLLDIVIDEKPDKVMLLGDIMDYTYNIATINAILDKFKVPIITIMGNCDCEQRLKQFHIENKGLYFVEYIGKRCIFYTHGHIYGTHRLPKILKKGDIFLHGHWHKGKLERTKGIIVASPGSISQPRDSLASYIILTNVEIVLKDVNGEVIGKLDLC